MLRVRSWACSQGLLSKLPSKLFETVDVSGYVRALERAGAQRLILQAGHPMQVALASGWMPAFILPQVPLSQQDLENVVEQFGLSRSPGALSLNNSYSHLT